VRLFAIACFAAAMFYGWTAADAMRTGVVHALGGKSNAEQRRDDPQSKFQRYLLARWLCCAGFVALGAVMQVSAGRFDKLESDDAK
jgi:hypothetical protein